MNKKQRSVEMKFRKLFLCMFLAIFVVCSPLSAFAQSGQDRSNAPQQTTLAQYEEAKELATKQENVTVLNLDTMKMKTR